MAARPAEYASREALRGAIEAVSDWQAVIEGAQRNRVTPLVLACLRNAGSPQVPPQVLAALHRQSIASVGRSLAKIPVLENLCAIFTQAQIRFLVVKGIPLSLQLYGDATRRTADDIDVLVSPDQFWQAGLVLAQSGYRCDTEIKTAARQKLFTDWIKDLRYTNEGFQTVVELHHRLTANPYLLEWTFDELWKDRVHVRVGAADVATLPSEKLPLYLFVHGANHAWERLRWLVDLTVSMQGLITVEKMLADAETMALRPAMLHALLLAHEWLGFPLAPQTIDQTRKDAKLKRLDFCLRRFRGRKTWLRRPRAKSWEWLWRFSVWFFLYNWCLKSGWRYRVYHYAAIWVHPADWSLIRLPPALFWLYPIIRPFGWLKRRLQR